MTTRKIIRIDEEKCDGCGQCATACAEGAIQIIDGKARLVSEVYCDGLGACIGECPQGALTIEERESAAFNEEAARKHLARQAKPEMSRVPLSHSVPSGVRHQTPLERKEKAGEGGPQPLSGHAAYRDASNTLRAKSNESGQGPPGEACGCPGTLSQTLKPSASTAPTQAAPSALANWPVQLRLVPVIAPYFKGADLLISADCAAYSHADFHRRFIAGRALVIGCPKLDDAALYREKLAQILRENNIKSLEIVYMEVPCCFGLVRLVEQAVADSGVKVPVTLTKIGIRGEVLESAVKEA